mgnify:CR=1 FL=1
MNCGQEELDPTVKQTLEPFVYNWTVSDDLCTRYHTNRCVATDIYDFLFLKASEGGSISAEHGIGQLKKAYLPLNRSAEELGVMKQLKESTLSMPVCYVRRFLLVIFTVCVATTGFTGSETHSESWESPLDDVHLHFTNFSSLF